MRNQRYREQGLTLTGLLFMAVLIGAAAMLAMRLFPIYNEKMKVDMALEKIASDPAAGDQTKQSLINAVMREFEVSDVDRWTTAEFSRLLQVEKQRESAGRVMSLDYEIRNSVCCDLDIVLNYHWARELPVGQVE